MLNFDRFHTDLSRSAPGRSRLDTKEELGEFVMEFNTLCYSQYLLTINCVCGLIGAGMAGGAPTPDTPFITRNDGSILPQFIVYS